MVQPPKPQMKLPVKHLVIYGLFVQAVLVQGAESLSCSQPTTRALLSALQRHPSFRMSEVRPVTNLRTPTNITLSFTLFGIMDVNEKAQILETFIWFEMGWVIEDLTWDPDECGTTRVSVPRTKLWMPDIVINEFMGENTVPTTYYVYLDNRGVVNDSQPLHVVSSCSLNIYTFPFDIQNCSYTFNSYKHSAYDILLALGRSVEQVKADTFSAMKTRGEWELIDIQGFHPEMPVYSGTPWDEVRFYIILKRQPTLYVVNLLVPSFFLLAVDLFSFLLPPKTTDRSTFKMTLILGYTVFLLLMSDLLPVTGNTIPLINVFFSMCLALMVASLLETIVITNFICGSSKFSPLPHWVRVLVLHSLARLVGLGSEPAHKKHSIPSISEVYENNLKHTSMTPSKVLTGTHKVDSTKITEQLTEQDLEELRKMNRDLQAIHHQLEKHFTSEQHTEEWVLLGQVIDRLIFSLYILFITVSFIVILSIWLHSRKK